MRYLRSATADRRRNFREPGLRSIRLCNFGPVAQSARLLSWYASSVFDLETPERVVVTQIESAIAKHGVCPRITHSAQRQAKTADDSQRPAVGAQQSDLAAFIQHIQSRYSCQTGSSMARSIAVGPCRHPHRSRDRRSNWRSAVARRSEKELVTNALHNRLRVAASPKLFDPTFCPTLQSALSWRQVSSSFGDFKSSCGSYRHFSVPTIGGSAGR